MDEMKQQMCDADRCLQYMNIYMVLISAVLTTIKHMHVDMQH